MTIRIGNVTFDCDEGLKVGGFAEPAVPLIAGAI